MCAARKHPLESIAAKRAGSSYRSRQPVHRLAKLAGQSRAGFVIGGYIPNGNVLDAILVGYCVGRELMYAGAVRAGIPSEFRRVLLPHFGGAPETAMPVRQPAKPY